MSDKTWTVGMFLAVATFMGTCALVAALTAERPLPWEALLAASCATLVVLTMAYFVSERR